MRNYSKKFKFNRKKQVSLSMVPKSIGKIIK